MHPLLSIRPARVAAGALALAVATTASIRPAWAQFKVIGPDGSVTYTDRAPVDAGAKVQTLRRDGSTSSAAAPPAASSNAAANLPFELRTLVARFPVTLFTGTDCAPCSQGRSLLVQRGVPFAERTVDSDDDVAALQRLTRGRSLPALTVGGQALRGFQEQDWSVTLDLAGYPKDSRLPRNWQPAPASPLVARAAAPRLGVETIPLTGPAPAGSPRTDPPAEAEPSGPTIRF